MAKAAKTEAKTEPTVPGFPGEAPRQEGWFATNHIEFKDGQLHQLHKGVDQVSGETVWWWFPVKAAD